MSPGDRAVVDFLAENYSSPTATRTLWQRAGGRAKDVPQGTERPRDQWHELWRDASAGGHATPIALVREALQDFPGSLALLRWLGAQTSPAELETARVVADQLAALEEPVVSATVEELLRPLASSRDQTFAQIAPALEGRLEAPRRTALLEALRQIAAGASSKVLESVAKGVTEALMGTQGWKP